MNKFIIIILVTILVSSCQKSIDLKIPKGPEKLAVRALWLEDRSPLVIVRYTKNINEIKDAWSLDQETVVKNARVSIFRNGTLFDVLEYKENVRELAATNNAYVSPTRKLLPQDGNYTLQVTAPGFDDVHTESISFPAPVPIQTLTYRRKVGSNPVVGLFDEITIEFDDPKDQQNQYWLYFTETSYYNSTGDSVENFFGSDIQPNDPSFVQPSGGILFDERRLPARKILFTDELFNGTHKKMTFHLPSLWFDHNPSPSRHYSSQIHLANVTKGTFLYLRYQLLSDYNGDSPFNEPVSSYTNIPNGYGLFGLGSVSSYEIK